MLFNICLVFDFLSTDDNRNKVKITPKNYQKIVTV